MKSIIIGIFAFLTFLIVVGVLGFAFQGEDFLLYKFFAPRTEMVRRQVFEESKAYNQGIVQELRNQRFQYEKASPEHKQALGSLIVQQTSDYNIDKLPPDLRSFVDGLRNPSGPGLR